MPEELNTDLKHEELSEPNISIESADLSNTKESINEAAHHIPAHEQQAADSIRTDILEHPSYFSPADDLMNKITSEHIQEYLEGSRDIRQQDFKEQREKRLLTAFELTASLGSVVAVVYFLKDNPAILVNILYIMGGIGALWIWKKPGNK